MKSFIIPEQYKSSIIAQIKEIRKSQDPKKKDFSPTLLDFGPIQFLIARHFGFCYGVENAIEISYKAIEENPNKRIFLLSQMIHNPDVNEDLQQRGVRFIMDTSGKMLMNWEELSSDDIVLIPAFGTTIEIENVLLSKGIEIQKYNTTCPFVERVWKKSEKLGSDDYTIIIHGKHNHEETRATFSHSKIYGPSVIIKDLDDAKKLEAIINGEIKKENFYSMFEGRYSAGFDIDRDLIKIGVVNQTTMLATETQEIADYLKKSMCSKYGDENLKDHFADTRDTLCYATNDNQQSTLGLLENEADLAIVVGGYNSSNTSHIVELCEQKFPTYFISSEREILSNTEIKHFDYHNHKENKSENYIPEKEIVKIILTSGASCPDAVVDKVLIKLLSYFNNTKPIEDLIKNLTC